jgi:hypothetical protein
MLDRAHRLYLSTRTQKQLATCLDRLEAIGLAGEISTSGRTSDAVAIQNQNRRPSQRPPRTSFRIPPWLIPYAWSITVEHAAVGWTVSLRCCRVLRWDYPGLDAIRGGDLQEVQRQICTGALSIYDEDPYQCNLIDVRRTLREEWKVLR